MGHCPLQSFINLPLMWKPVAKIPSILHRLTGLLVAKECNVSALRNISRGTENKESVAVEDHFTKYGLESLERCMNYPFKNKSLLVEALTHVSYSSNRVTNCYQRLEFLGDAV